VLFVYIENSLLLLERWLLLLQ